MKFCFISFNDNALCLKQEYLRLFKFNNYSLKLYFIHTRLCLLVKTKYTTKL